MPAPAADELRLTLFCYPNPCLPALFAAWAAAPHPVTCLVPAGVAAGALDAWTGGRVPRVGGGGHRRDALTLHAVPFLPQDDYDRLLWAADVNFVRGEDSFVRAQWAGRPFVWQAYPQEGGAHFAKVDAFLDRYAPRFGPGAAAAIRSMFRVWNGDPGAGPAAEAWSPLRPRPGPGRRRRRRLGRRSRPFARTCRGAGQGGRFRVIIQGFSKFQPGAYRGPSRALRCAQCRYQVLR